MKLLVKLIVLLGFAIFGAKGFAKCYSRHDKDGQMFMRQLVRETPIFVKGFVRNYAESKSEINFDIEVVLSLKGESVPDKLRVSIPKTLGSGGDGSPKKYSEGQLAIFPVNSVGDPFSEVVTSNCVPYLSEDEFRRIEKSASTDPVPNNSPEPKVKGHPKHELSDMLLQTKCHPPANSSWGWDLTRLTEKTTNIFVGVVLGSESTKTDKTIVPDFQEYGYAFDCKSPNGHGLTKCETSQMQWNFKIVSVLKGHLPEGKSASVITANGPSGDVRNNPAKMAILTCDEILNFKKSHYYLVFQNSFNPLGYREVAGPSDKLVTQVRQHIGLKNLFKEE